MHGKRCPCRRRPAPPARWSRREGCGTISTTPACWQRSTVVSRCPSRMSSTDPFVRKQAVRSLLRCTVRKDLWKRRSRALLPTPPHLLDPAPHPPVGMGAPAELALRPASAPRCSDPIRPATRSGSSHNASRQPACRTSSTPGAPAPLRAGLAGSPMSRQHPPSPPHGTRSRHARGRHSCTPAPADHHAGFPVGNPTCRLRQHMRGKVRNPHRRQEQEAVVVHGHHPPQPRATGSPAPADIPVPRLLVPARRAEADPTQTPEPRRFHQIVQRLAGMPRSPLRMVRRHHRTEPPRTLATLGRFQRNRSQSRQRRLHMQVWMRRQCIPRRRRRCRRRELQPQLRRQPRQDLPRRRNAWLAPRVAPVRASAQLARKRATARASLPDRALKPRKSFRAKLSQANLHTS